MRQAERTRRQAIGPVDGIEYKGDPRDCAQSGDGGEAMQGHSQKSSGEVGWKASARNEAARDYAGLSMSRKPLFRAINCRFGREALRPWPIQQRSAAEPSG